MFDKYGIGQDPYCYPGTEVLRNRLGVTDDAQLNELERSLTAIAASEIDLLPPPYNLAVLQRIHRHLFCDIYDWAGKIRTVNIRKPPTQFCQTLRIEPEAEKLFRALEEARWFEGMGRDELISAVADLYGEVNMLHPFREGNGRAQRILFDFIVVNVGFQIDWWQVDQGEWIQANIAAAHYCDSSLLAEIFDRCIGAPVPV